MDRRRRKKAQQNAKLDDNWKLLKEVYEADPVLKWDVCNSSKYDKFLKSLPSIDLGGLVIPSNANILFYGTSFLHQILSNILAGNSNTLTKNGPFGGLEGIRLDDLPDKDYRFAGYVVRWDFDAIGSTITEVQNSFIYQTVENLDHENGLKAYLQSQRKPFDVAFFMNPHPPCYWSTTCPDPDGNLVEGAEKDLYTNEGDYVGDRSDVAPLWETINHAVNGQIYEVEAWCSIERTDFHADEDHLIRTTSNIKDYPCNTLDSCDSTELNGHQCQPGRLAFVAETVVAKMYGAMR